MKIPEIDAEKLKKAMEIIEEAAALMEEDYDKNQEKVEALGKELEALAGKSIDIFSFDHYWSHTSLEEMGKAALLPRPEVCALTDAEIKDILIHFDDYLKQYGEASMDYIVDFLAVNTGLPDMIDYIFYPENVGLELDNSMEMTEYMAAIAHKISADRRK